MRLIYLSPVPWCSFVQRPHEFVTHFHDTTGGEVMWIDPYPTRLPVLGDVRRLGSANGVIFRPGPKWLAVVRAAALPLEPVPVVGACNLLLWAPTIRKACDFAKGGETTLAIGKPSALALTLLTTLAVERSLYDAMDDFPAFYGGISRWSMERCERAIAQRVSRVLASSSNLVRKFSDRTRDAALVLNGCASELPHLRVKARVSSRPLVGYVGTMGWWFDWDMLARLARTRPDCDFRLIGPMYSKPVWGLPANVEVLPSREHAKALLAVRDFDVGVIPFKKNLLTSSVDPIKYYECRALGVPVVSSAFGEMAARNEDEGVFHLNERAGFGEAVDKALRHRRDERSAMLFREKNSWKKRFDSARLFAASA
jgi:hypothetical protein